MRVEKAIREQLGVKEGAGARWAGRLLGALALYGLLYCLLGAELLPPRGRLFLLLALALALHLAGLLAARLTLPPLLGMILVGLLFRNLHLFTPDQNISGVLRDLALGVILIKAGLGLDGGALRASSGEALRLALCPCLAEALAAALAARHLAALPWLWALLLGFLLAAVSPAVVVPSLLALKEEGYGEDKGVATLVIAASSLDDVAAISCFGVFLAMIFSPGENLVYQILRGPLELLIGLSAGVGWGLVAAFFPHRDSEEVGGGRIWVVGCGALCGLVGSKALGLPGAGPLACITSSFLAALSWNLQGWPPLNPVTRFFSKAWLVMQPVLFGLIGAEIDLGRIQMEDVGSGLAILAICLPVRIMICFLVLLGGKLNLKEIFFVSLAWLPKATVQAALSTVALELVAGRGRADDPDLARAKALLTTAVLAVLLTAPLGSVAISLAAPYLLSKPLPTADHPPENPTNSETA